MAWNRVEVEREMNLPGDGLETIQMERLERIRAILAQNRKFWPLTPKQLYYLAVLQGEVGRDVNAYAEFSELVRSALGSGRLPPKALWQSAPTVQVGGAWENQDEFLRAELDDLLWGYRRDLMQGQPRYVEVWLEKGGVYELRLTE